MRNLLLALLLCSCGTDKLVKARDPKCDQPCYDGRPEHAGKGTCTFGVWVCDDEGNTVSCRDWGVPQDLACNGLDNNCDGAIDTFWTPCETACGKGKILCRAGEWRVCDAKQPALEICDGLDNDCDGTIDNLVGQPPACYEGPPGTLGKGTPTRKCNYGHSECVGGVTLCVGQTLPEAEICDGFDNDCDGSPDDGLDKQKPFDFVFGIDTSGSMQGTIDSVKLAVAGWSIRYSQDPRYRFALITIPDMNLSLDGQVTRYLNFSDAAQFKLAVDAQAAVGGGSEVTIDAVNDVANYSFNPLQLAWTVDSTRTLIIFADEYPQTNPARMLTTSQAAMAVATTNPKLVVYIFTRAENFSSYSVMTTPNGGKVIDITLAAGLIQRDLDSILAFATCR